jgi:phage terminase large subunit-like protein
VARVVAVDPSDGEDDANLDQKHDDFGIAVCSKGMDGVGYVEQSYSWSSSPRKMAESAIDLYYAVGADALVIERNHGGRWMEEVFRSIDPYCNIITTWASDGKRTRAAPVAALFEKDSRNPKRPFRARMVGFHEDLEQELTTHDFTSGMRSPNELDAMVWGLNELMLGGRQARARDDVKDKRLAGRR